MKFIFVILSLALSFSAQAIEVSGAVSDAVLAVDCLNDDIATLDLTNDQLNELSQKCDKEADELFKKATKAQDQGLISQTDAIRKSAEIAKTLRQERMKGQKIKKTQEFKSIKKEKAS